MYCGGQLPQGVPESEEQRSLPTDLDQLFRQAMSLGTTHRLESALRAHQHTSEAPLSTKSDAIEDPVVTMSRTERLLEIQQICADAVMADAAEDEEALVGSVTRLHEALELHELRKHVQSKPRTRCRCVTVGVVTVKR